MNSGLTLTIKEFGSLPQKQQMACLYENQVKTLTAIKGYKFNQKIQWGWLTGLTAGMFFIIKQIVQIK